MLVLGITNNDLAGACLVRDDTVVAAASEERFTRVKAHKIWPEKSIEFVLVQAGINLEELDYVAYGWCAGFNSNKHLLMYFDRISEEFKNRPDALPHLRKRISDEIQNDKEKRTEFDAFIDSHGLRSKVVYIDHHDCHALGAYVCSPFEDALVLTCDGRGDFQSLTVRHVSSAGETVFQRETSIDSLGYFYGRITRLLGFKPDRHEGKVTGLAAYGDPNRLLPLMRSMIDLEGDRLRAKCGDLYQPSFHGYSDKLQWLIGQENAADVASAAQAHVENVLTTLVRKYVQQTGVGNVCLAGGVFANVKLNQRILEVPGVKNVYVLPAMGDGGLPLQAAVTTVFRQAGARAMVPSMALGPAADTTEEQLRDQLKVYPDLGYAAESDPTLLLMKALDSNQVVGVYRGRMEFGPRALGMRSIIYRADDVTMNDWLNKRLHRTEFMPFAPITAEELAKRCYLGWEPAHVSSRFMTITYQCSEDFQRNCPAVVHVDGTARPQVVRAQDDPFLHNVLISWHDRTDQAALVNTSFNKHEEPIVCSLRDALDAVRDGVIDLLLVDDKYFVWNEDRIDFSGIMS
jgi:carbamoyltransferase